MPQLGRVVIMNNVEKLHLTQQLTEEHLEIQINNGVKLDNLIQIGHNAEIGSSTIIAQTGIVGSTKIGKNCLIMDKLQYQTILQLEIMSELQANPGQLRILKMEIQF